MSFSVTAVVVSYNRAALLQECLDGLFAQTRRPDRVIVIDNASTDDALDVARRHPLRPEITELAHNVGGAGGFCAGVALALDTPASTTHDMQYVWLMDDDTIPTATALEKLLATASAARGVNGVWPTALGSKAVWVDGREHLMNKPRERTWLALGRRHLHEDQAGAASATGTRSFVPDPFSAMAGTSFQVRSLSFVSCLISMRAIHSAHTLPKSAYFLWNDDFEFTTRLLKRGTGYYVPDSQVVHKTKVFGSSDADPGARFFYEVRNKCWILRCSRHNFTPAEYVELLLKTARRWVLTFMRSKDRRLTFDCLKRGLHEGLGSKPHSDTEILAGNDAVVRAVDAVEAVKTVERRG